MRSDLKELRVKKLGLSQAELAVKAEVSIGIVSGVESGRIRSLSVRVARKLALAYGVAASELVESLAGGNVLAT